MKGFKRCDNGHFYKEDLPECPYCPKSSTRPPAGNDEQETEHDVSNAKDNNNHDVPTEYANDSSDGMKTKVTGGDFKTEMVNNDVNDYDKTNISGGGNHNPANIPPAKQSKNLDQTYIGVDMNEPEDDKEKIPGQKKQAPAGPRPTRKLIGWLVSYTIDANGIDFRLFEGRNTIGRKPSNDICVDTDVVISSHHATVRYRKGVTKIKDEFTTNGTYVNGKDIDDEVVQLNDGDEIKIGSTVFKFKSSL